MEETWFSFTRTELEIARLLAQGLSNDEIARRRKIKVRTVEFHLTHIYEKLEVKARPEAIIKLRETPGFLQPDPRESTAPSEPGLRESPVAQSGGSGDNGDNSIPLLPVEPPPARQPEASQPPQGPPEDPPDRSKGWRRRRFFLILAGLVLAVLVVLWLVWPAWWMVYAREAEYPEGSTVGQTIERPGASMGKVHGQFGVTAAPPWPGQSGQVVYRGVFVPLPGELYLNLRYSKFSPPFVPIQVFLDDEIAPRRSLDTIDQHSWEAFAETGPVSLGEVRPGLHSIRFFTAGQTYGTADLDRFELMIKMR